MTIEEVQMLMTDAAIWLGFYAFGMLSGIAVFWVERVAEERRKDAEYARENQRYLERAREDSRIVPGQRNGFSDAEGNHEGL